MLSGAASGEWFLPQFTWHGFRYVAFWWLNSSESASTISSVTALQLYANVTRVSTFVSSSEVMLFLCTVVSQLPLPYVPGIAVMNVQCPVLYVSALMLALPLTPALAVF